MPRDLEGPDRYKKTKRDASAERSNASRPDTRNVDPSSVHSTLSPARTGGREANADTLREDGGGDIRRVFDEQRAQSRHSPVGPDTGARLDSTAADTHAVNAHAVNAHNVGGEIRSRGTRETAGTGNKPSRLKYAEGNTQPAPHPALSEKAAATRYRADKAYIALQRAREQLPHRHGVRVELTFDEQRKKMKRRLVFEEEVKSRQAHLRGPVAARPVKAGANAALMYAHKKIHETEHENVGVEAGHKAGLAAESGLRMAHRHNKLAPYRKADRLAQKSARMNARAAYEKALSDNVKSKKSALSRAAQKRKIKRDYAKAARKAKKTGKYAKKTGEATASAAKAIAAFAEKHPVAFAVILLIILLIIILITVISSCAGSAMDGAGTVLSSSYLAPDADIDDAELAYTEWEADLLLEINGTERTYPGYDEYRYSIDDIGHDPHALMAYLTAFHNDFSYSGIETELRVIFEQQYSLSYTEEIEIRTRTVTMTDSDTGESYEQEEEYEWRILHITLVSQSFTDAVYPRMDAELVQRYSLLTRVKGNCQYVGSPLAFNWLHYVSDYYGWRLSGGGKEYHKGVDIAVATGTEILAAHDGTVRFAGTDAGGALAVYISGEKGIETRYAHCSELLVSQGQSVQMGDVIAKVGSNGSSAGPHLHFELLRDGRYLNPLYFALTNDDGSGYIPPGLPGGIPIPAYPGTPMDNARFAAMMEEAQKHLGKPYVFGASGPNSFDCSGFVSWVLSHTIYPGFRRTNAQGLYNICTPVSRVNAQPGDLIFFTGTYDAGRPVTHVGLYIGNGQMIHAGKPINYSSIDTPYFTKHFYAFGRLP